MISSMVDIRTSCYAARLAAFSYPQKHWKALIFRGALKVVGLDAWHAERLPPPPPAAFVVPSGGSATAEDPPGFASYPGWPRAGGGDGGRNRAASLVRISRCLLADKTVTTSAARC